jgi:uncharacterized membrane protein YphA (DoxX/SURF4 family)
MTQSIHVQNQSLSEPVLTHSSATPYRLLHILFSVVPIVAGFDKFTNLLTHWEQYLSPMILQMVPVPANVLMMSVGVIEIIAGILVALRPRIGAPLVAVWLLLIATNLLMTGHYFDIAVRDIGLAVAASALFLLARSNSTNRA